MDTDRLAAEALHLVSIPSVTGDERAVMEAAAALCDAHGLETELHRHDLALLRAHPDHPGEEAPRDDLWGVKATLPGTAPGRIAIDGHLDVVPGGPPPRLDGERLYGRGSVDMTGPWIAALHAIASLGAEHPEIVLLGVPSEEDGGLGTFAALEDDDDYDAALLPEPTGFDVVVAQAGALTFNGIVTGTATHAAMRLEGESALDRYIDEIAPALRAHEAEINTGVEHPAMAALPLPYPVSVGRLETGEWSSSVPDHLVFEGRLGVRVGEEPAAARTALEERLGMKLTWTGGAFHSGAIDPEDPWAVRVAAAVEAETGTAPARAGVPWGADMRLFTARGIPAVMVGPNGIERAHSDHEWASLRELEQLARILRRALTASVG